MNLSSRIFLGIGALAVAAAIGFDAWHAHGLRSSLDSEAHEAFGRGIRIHYVAGLGLAIAGLLVAQRPSRLSIAAGAAIGLGGLIFCAEVYRGALGASTFGIAPQGGTISILGWLVLGIGALLPTGQARS